MKRWLLLLLLIPVAGMGLQACAPKYQDEPDCGFVQNVYGERISWQSNVPVTLYIHSSFPSQFYPALENAIRNWETTMGRPLFRIGAYGITSSGPRQDGHNVIYWMNTWEANKASEQARTSVYWVQDEIKEADIRINDKNFNFYLDAPMLASPNVHLESLLIHELGHVLGLKHKDDSYSVMATYLASLTPRTQIGSEDRTNLSCEY